MNVSEINKYINMLVGNLSFSMDYNNLVNGSKRLLIVEGQTDKKFIESILEDDIICIVANKAFGNKHGFGQMSINCKSAIIRVVYGMSKVPVLLNIPKGFEKSTVYGLIDLDYDSSNGEYLSTTRLFVTDTHDLETLLISTDDGILQKIEECNISVEDSQKAFFMAYQIGKIRKALFDVNDTDLSLQVISSGSNREIDYSVFVENYGINVVKMIKYINRLNDNCLSQNQEKKLTEKVIKDKSMKKYLDSNSIWKESWDSFDPLKHSDYWSVVNGHDILSILRYLNRDAARKYSNAGSFSLNRDFEMDLIDHYDYSALKDTKLYSDMYKESVVTDI